ncbi:MAG: hypothetical protein WCL51_09590 [Bacteroidota bacterium]
MKPIITFENETILLDLTNNLETFILTNERVRHSKKSWGFNDITSILLKEITSITVHYSSYIIFIILAIISGLYTIITFINKGGYDFISYSLIFTVLMIILFFSTRRNSITICASNGKIDYDIKGYNNYKLIELIDTIELAIKKVNTTY